MLLYFSAFAILVGEISYLCLTTKYYHIKLAKSEKWMLNYLCFAFFLHTLILSCLFLKIKFHWNKNLRIFFFSHKPMHIIIILHIIMHFSATDWYTRFCFGKYEAILENILFWFMKNIKNWDTRFWHNSNRYAQYNEPWCNKC